MRINVALFSVDEELAKFCSEVLSEVFGPESALVTRTPGEAFTGEELCIWDYAPGEGGVPRDLDAADLRKHLFLLYRKHLPALREHLGTPDLNVLLKPITRATLRAFLSGAARRGDEAGAGSGASAAALRVERDEMLQVLIQANLKLQEYDQERNNFLARSVHDFRAPLTAITGYCGLLLEEELGALTPEQVEILRRMQHSAKRLTRLSNAMFQLTVPHGVEERLNLEKGDIRDCVSQALYEVALPLEDKRISVAVDVEPPEDLLFERAQMEQTLVNLLENACKFTPRAGAIEIRGYPYFWERRVGRAAPLGRSRDRRVALTESPNAFRIDIRDSGPGIPPSHIEKVFEEYASYAGGQDRSGGGLGLAICRMILQRHRGRVWAESDPAGGVFSFVLPLRQDVAEGSARMKAREKADRASVVEN
ncbi:MAG TPA: HAMP domain-containing sensor histidine kinase [Bryobacteraceae bacterium]|nr:HAMP domain-containing sensor histidine kinase [Bryobacteraceae bacterium]